MKIGGADLVGGRWPVQGFNSRDRRGHSVANYSELFPCRGFTRLQDEDEVEMAVNDALCKSVGCDVGSVGARGVNTDNITSYMLVSIKLDPLLRLNIRCGSIPCFVSEAVRRLQHVLSRH